MDIKISNKVRQVEIVGLECEELLDCFSYALGLWQDTEEKPVETGSVIGFHSENTYQDNNRIVALDIEQPRVT